MEEIQSLIQGLRLPSRHSVAVDTLPPAVEIPSDVPPMPLQPFIIDEAADNVIHVSSSRAPSTSSTSLSASVQPVGPAANISQSTPPRPISRTTEWRKRKNVSAGAVVPRKTYCCRVCGDPISTGEHTQFRGQRFCSKAEGQTLTKAEWLAQKRAEAATKKSSSKK